MLFALNITLSRNFATAIRSAAVSALESYAAGSKLDGVTIFIF